jgi:hypothetical protein
MNTGILGHQEILELHAAVMSAGMSEMRTGLLAHVDSDFAASLRVTAAPAEQVLIDLSMMNTAGNLANGTVPLEAWLSNAVALAVTARP